MKHKLIQDTNAEMFAQKLDAFNNAKTVKFTQYQPIAVSNVDYGCTIIFSALVFYEEVKV